MYLRWDYGYYVFMLKLVILLSLHSYQRRIALSEKWVAEAQWNKGKYGKQGKSLVYNIIAVS
jgi:hypothetical protein